LNISEGSYLGEDALWLFEHWLGWGHEVWGDTDLEIVVMDLKVEVSKFEEVKELAWNNEWGLGQNSINWWKSLTENLIDEVFNLSKGIG